MTGKPNDAYHQDPAEFDAYGSNIAQHIRTALLKLNPPKRTQAVLKLKNWLRQSNPAQTGLDTIFSWMGFGSTPSVMMPSWFWDVQQSWRKNPALWRRFKQRLYTLIDSISS